MEKKNLISQINTKPSMTRKTKLFKKAISVNLQNKIMSIYLVFSNAFLLDELQGEKYLLKILTIGNLRSLFEQYFE